MKTEMKIDLWRAAAAAATLLLASTLVQAAGETGSTGPSTAVSFVEIPGSPIKRVILTEKATERLGIETGEVSEQKIVLTQMVGGFVTPPREIPQKDEPLVSGTFGGFTLAGTGSMQEPPADIKFATGIDDTWVLVTLSPGELKRVRLDSAVRILALPTRDKLSGEVLAHPSKFPLLEDSKRSMLQVFYVVAGKDHGLKPGQRVRVEMPLVGPEEELKVVPYGAVYFDGNGDAWVYANPEPLIYERQAVTVARVVGDLAVISDGPPLGTRIVTVGAALLYGAEVIFKR